MIIVHHLQDSRSQRILWLLEELGLAYEVRAYKRGPALAAPPELGRIHPLGKAPIVEQDGIVLAETGAIVEHLVAGAGGRLGAPADPAGARDYHYFLHYAEGSAMTVLLMRMVVGLVPLFGRAARRRLQPRVDAHFDFIEATLAAQPWFAGAAFSAADVMMSFPIEFGLSKAGGQRHRPATAAWLATIQARPAYRAALARGGPYRFASS